MAHPKGVEGSGMAGPGETLGSPWPPPLSIRPCKKVTFFSRQNQMQLIPGKGLATPEGLVLDFSRTRLFDLQQEIGTEGEFQDRAGGLLIKVLCLK
jgi:hypothetical protein